MREFIHTFRKTGKRRSVNESSVCGWTSRGEDFIWVNAELPPRQILDTYVHEWLHGEFPRWSEAKVEEYENRIAGILWSHGIRKGEGYLNLMVWDALIRACGNWPYKYRPQPSGLAQYLRNAGYGQ